MNYLHISNPAWVTIFNYSASKASGIFESRGKITGSLRGNVLIFGNFSWFLHNFNLFSYNLAGILLTFTLLLLKFENGNFITARKATGMIGIFRKNCHPCNPEQW